MPFLVARGGGGGTALRLQVAIAICIAITASVISVAAADVTSSIQPTHNLRPVASNLASSTTPGIPRAHFTFWDPEPRVYACYMETRVVSQSKLINMGSHSSWKPWGGTWIYYPETASPEFRFFNEHRIYDQTNQKYRTIKDAKDTKLQAGLTGWILHLNYKWSGEVRKRVEPVQYNVETKKVCDDELIDFHVHKYQGDSVTINCWSIRLVLEALAAVASMFIATVALFVFEQMFGVSLPASLEKGCNALLRAIDGSRSIEDQIRNSVKDISLPEHNLLFSVSSYLKGWDTWVISTGEYNKLVMMPGSPNVVQVYGTHRPGTPLTFAW